MTCGQTRMALAGRTARPDASDAVLLSRSDDGDVGEAVIEQRLCGYKKRERSPSGDERESLLTDEAREARAQHEDRSGHRWSLAAKAQVSRSSVR